MHSFNKCLSKSRGLNFDEVHCSHLAMLLRFFGQLAFSLPQRLLQTLHSFQTLLTIALVLSRWPHTLLQKVEVIVEKLPELPSNHLTQIPGFLPMISLFHPNTVKEVFFLSSSEINRFTCYLVLISSFPFLLRLQSYTIKCPFCLLYLWPFCLLFYFPKLQIWLNSITKNKTK